MSNMELRRQLKEEHKCVHCQDPLPEGYDNESCPRCLKIIKRGARDDGWRWKLFIQVLDHYGWACKCCGEREPMFLTVDHKEGGGNEDRRTIRKDYNEWYRAIIKNGFPEDLEIACYNCNLGRSRNGGICPHKETTP